MDRDTFLSAVTRYRNEGWRLSIINATSILPDEALSDGAFDVTWSFARGTDYETLRERITPGDALPSISALYGSAFLYENEMRELFGIEIEGLEVDLRGELYKTAERVPFAPSAIKARLEKAGRSTGPAHHPAPAKPAGPVPGRQDGVAPGRRGEDKADPSTRASAHETRVSEGAQDPTQSSPARLATPGPEVRG